LENNEHWESLGFKVENGNSTNGSHMVISRPSENSPLIKNELLENSILDIRSFHDFDSEVDFVVASIVEDISQELLPEDIAVICLDNRHMKQYFSAISDQLLKYNINCFNHLNAPSDNITYKVKNNVTLSSIFKAKGNESGCVYIVGIDSIFKNKDSIRERNKLFTAITRSEAWVTLTGSKPEADICIEEYNRLKKASFKLDFIQPSEESTRTIYQEISRQQEQFNQMERIADELKKLGFSEEQIKNKFLSIFKKK
jgi:superfamily I DNA and RNA helicase